MTKQETAGTRFSGLAHVVELEDGFHAALEEALVYVTADFKWPIAVPAGFVTDFASIPRLLWNVLPPHGRYSRGAIVHDFLYQAAPTDARTGLPVTRAEADRLLREMCGHLGTSRLQSWAIWIGLKAGGWVAWRRYRSVKEPSKELDLQHPHN